MKIERKRIRQMCHKISDWCTSAPGELHRMAMVCEIQDEKFLSQYKVCISQTIQPRKLHFYNY